MSEFYNYTKEQKQEIADIDAFYRNKERKEAQQILEKVGGDPAFAYLLQQPAVKRQSPEPDDPA